MRILAAFALLTTLTQSATPPPCTEFSPTPIPIAHLPTYFLHQKPTTLAALLATEEIRATLSLYAYTIDSRTYASLSSVFTPDAVANYSAPLGVLTGIEAIKTTLSTALAQFAGTQHLLGSQSIRLCGKDRAVSATYFRAVHFLQNATVGATGVVDGSGVLYAYAQYQDSWVKRDGAWKVAYRNVVYMGPLVTDLS